MVQSALEDRNLSQDPEAGMQARSSRALYGGRLVNFIAILCILGWRIRRSVRVERFIMVSQKQSDAVENPQDRLLFAKTNDEFMGLLKSDVTLGGGTA